MTFEYVLLAGVNDSDADADRLAAPAARACPCKVNLIPWNPFPGPAFERPSAERIRTFQERLRAAAMAVYIRTPRGDDIDAACGQLAARAAAGARRCSRGSEPIASRRWPPPTTPRTSSRRARDLGVDTCGRIAEFWGFTRTMGRTFGLLYLSHEPLPQAEIQARLGISAGSASMTLAALGRWGVVHRVWVRGQRREHYQAETDFWKMISGVLNERERREIGAAVEAVERGGRRARRARPPRRAGAAGKQLAAEAAFTAERLERLHEICALGETLLDMLLGQLTMDVGHFRDVLKVEAPAAARRRTRRAAAAPLAQPRRRAARKNAIGGESTCELSIHFEYLEMS